jgi:hypothetical protein
MRDDQLADSGPGSPGGGGEEEEREYRAWKKSIILVLGQVGTYYKTVLFSDSSFEGYLA